MSKYIQPLQKKVDKKKDETHICAFDMETNGLGGSFIVCAFVTDDGIRELTHTLSDAFNFIIEHPTYRFIAHNAAGYEFAYLYHYIYDYFIQHDNIDLQPTLQGDNRIVQFRILKDGKQWIDIRDTLCLFNTSLEKVAKSYCPELPKLSGTINWDKEIFDPGNPNHMSYLWRDCDTLLLSYQRLRDLIWEIFHCNIGVTAGRTAMNAWQTTIPEGRKYYRNPQKKEDFFRNAYYGACVFPGHKIGDWGDVTSVDINAAYGYQMRRYDFPTSTPSFTQFYHQGIRGIYEVVAHVPEKLFETLGFNPIPYRTKYGLQWPSGTFTTTITDVEIEYARSVGCTIEIIQGYVWHRCESLFKAFIDLCEGLELDGDGRYKPMVKLLRNSLYGKFGTKEEHQKILYSHKGFPETPCVPIINEYSGEWIDGLYTATEKTESPYIQPHIAAFITAFQRVYLMGFIQRCYEYGATTVYCDTDSIKCDSAVILTMVAENVIPVGKRYGQFKIEERVHEFIVIGSKAFYGKGLSGEIKKSKGIPTRATNRTTYTEALKGRRDAVSFDSVTNVMALIKGRTMEIAVKRKRKITDITNSTAWRIEGNTIYAKEALLI